MASNTYQSEVRDSTVRELLEKVRKKNYKDYLLTLRLERIRQFRGATIKFDFPVTALIGPNGSGKSTILGAAALSYNSLKPSVIFRKSRIGDEAMDDWLLVYELVSKDANPKGTVKEEVAFRQNSWTRTHDINRMVKHININRTVPAGDNPLFSLKKKLSTHGALKQGQKSITSTPVENIDHIKNEAEKILGRSLQKFQLFEVVFTTNRETDTRRIKRQSKNTIDDATFTITYTIVDVPTERKPLIARQYLYVGNVGDISYSEFSFGSGEASVIHLVADVEALPDNSLVLIEEIENGLHPLAVCRLVDYLITAAERKNLQIIFTTHSDYALAPLPSEAIWAAIDGKLEQGRLSIEVLRSVSGRIDKRLAIFVEDEFAKAWIEAVLREQLGEASLEIGVYPLFGDGNAVAVHRGHLANPSIQFRSVCFIDGDSRQIADEEGGIFRLPGTMPEATVFNGVLSNIENNIALLTVACQRPVEKQALVAAAVHDVSHTNRDPHLLFSQLGLKLSFMAEATVRGAFLALWIAEHPGETAKIADAVSKALKVPQEDGKRR